MQVSRIVNYCEENGSISNAEAVSIGIGHLSSVISAIRFNSNYKIEKWMVDHTNQYGEKCKYMRYKVVEV